MPTLKSSVFFSRFEEGVVFRGGSAPVIFRGKRAYDLVRAVVALMERGLGGDALLAQLPDPVRGAAAQLLGDLGRHGLLRERDENDARFEDGLPPRLANLWSYAADHHRTPGSAMESWAAQTFAVQGTAAGQLFAVRALAECGALHFRLEPAAEPAADPGFDPAAALAALRAEHGWIRTDAPPLPDALRVYAAGGSEYRAEGCDAADCWFFGLLSGHLVLGFVQGRLPEILPRWAAAMRPAVPGWREARVSDQRIALAAGALAFGALKRHLGVATGPDLSRPHRIDASGQVLPVALPGPVRLFPQGSAAQAPAEHSAEEEGEEEGAAADLLFDPVTGILAQDEDDLLQVPLSVSRLRVFAADRETVLGTAGGAGTSAREARRLAIQRGVRSHLQALYPGGAVAVEWSAEASRANALAAAALAAPAGPGGWTRLEGGAELSPEVSKLLRLLALLGGGDAMVEVRRIENPPAAAVRIALNGTAVAEESAADFDTAAARALGDACAALQVPGGSAAPPPPAPLQPGTLGGIATVDLGYAGLARYLHCTLLEAEGR